MVNPCAPPFSTPPLSIVIATYNDWGPLNLCLQSLSEQTDVPGFEVVVVDDGSDEIAPDFICGWTSRFPLTIIRQAHQGISVARNLGIENSHGAVLAFVDADCKLQSQCLATLGARIRENPERNYFQLRLIGDCSRLVGRAEELRLITIQSHMLQPDGHIRYLNTAGFAIRRNRAAIAGGLFNPSALRAEDTLLMVNLMQSGELPWFVSDAVVQHAIPLSLFACFLKDIRSAYLERSTYEIIASEGIKFRVSHRERLGMLWTMWKTSAQRSIGRLAWFALAIRQTLRLAILPLDASGLRLTSRVSAKSS
jgi:glycosyltransferase involved in cell wall biosynthesis